MKLNINSEAAVGSGLKKVSDFKMDMNAKAARVLSDTLYKDKHGSIIRELCSNAYDAHKECGKEDVPFKISLPDRFTSMLTIRDYGPGISPEDIDSVYSTYFASTKDQSNDSVGAFGLGSKTPFSLTDSFMVTSIHKGVKRVYNAFMNEGKPSISQFGEDEKTDEPNGLEVSITVKEKDISSFRDAVVKQLRFFPVKPEINGNIEWPEIEETLLEVDGFTYFKHNSDLLRGFFIKTGPVAYPVDFEVLFSHYKNNDMEIPQLLLFMQRMSNSSSYGMYGRRNPEYNKGAVVEMPIGTVEVTPSREALSYSEFTLDNIVTVIDQIKSKLFDTVRDRLHEKYDESYATFMEYFKNLDNMMLDSIDADYVAKHFDPFAFNRGELMIKLPEKFCPFERKSYRSAMGKPELMNTSYIGHGWKDSAKNKTTDAKGNETHIPFEDTLEHKTGLAFITNNDSPVYIKDEAYAFAKRCFDDSIGNCSATFEVIKLEGTGSNQELYDYLNKIIPDRVKLVSETEKPSVSKGGHSTTGGRTRQWFYLDRIRRVNPYAMCRRTLYTLGAADEYDLNLADFENGYNKNEVVFFTTFNNKLDAPATGLHSIKLVLNYLYDVENKSVIAVPRNKAKKFSKSNCAIHIDDFLATNKDAVVSHIEDELKGFLLDTYNTRINNLVYSMSTFFNTLRNEDISWSEHIDTDRDTWQESTSQVVLAGIDSSNLKDILSGMDREDIHDDYLKLQDAWTKVTDIYEAEKMLTSHGLTFVSFADHIKRIESMLLDEKNENVFLKEMVKARYQFTSKTSVADPFNSGGTDLLDLADLAEKVIDRVA